MNDFYNFLEQHWEDDITKLLLNKNKWQGIDINLAVNTIEGRRKIKNKLPLWYNQSKLIYPNLLCTEQCSSEHTATLKGDICKKLGVGKVLDLTGGLGVDSFAFSRVCSTVFYNELQLSLKEAAEHNFSVLGANNIVCSSIDISSENISGVMSKYKPDLVYIDPARRGQQGNKVFKIEDCQPNVMLLKDKILEYCNYILLKLSPMADIKLLCDSLGNVKNVWVVARKGECKEILILICKNYSGLYNLNVIENTTELNFIQNTEHNSIAKFIHNIYDVYKFYGKLIFEPGKAITKAGLFNTISATFNLIKFGKSTHLYFLEDQQTHNNITDLGKVFVIDDILDFNSKNIKLLSKQLKNCEVTCKNLPISSVDLAKKIGCKSGGDKHIFAVKIDCNNNTTGNFIFITHRILF